MAPEPLTGTPPQALPVYRFGTSGYRSNTDTGFNDDVVRHITAAIADCLVEGVSQTGRACPVLIGGDTREKSRRAIPVVSAVLRERGFDVLVAESDIPTPVLAFAAKHWPGGTLGAVLLTASHNPWDYGGYNFLTPDAAVVPATLSERFAERQRHPVGATLDRVRYGLSPTPTEGTFDPFPLYQAHLKDGLGIRYDRIRERGLQICYDPLYATGREIFPRLLAAEGIAVAAIHNTAERPAGYAGMPEPSGKNLAELSARVRALSDPRQGLVLGLANDGDADRFGVLDEAGRYLPPNDVLALVLHHLLAHRKGQGAVVRSQATSHRLDALARRAGLEVVQTPVGYKYIAETFLEYEPQGRPVLLGGESSGGLSIGGHIPEKDGLLANLLVAELVAEEGRPVGEILREVNASLPEQFAFSEWAVKTDQGPAVLEGFLALAEAGGMIGSLGVDVDLTARAAEALEGHFGTRDGVKLYLEGGAWVLVRISGTEPLARVYVEVPGPSETGAQAARDAVLSEIRALLTGRFGVAAADIHEKD